MNITTKKFMYSFILTALCQSFFCMSMDIEPINDDDPEERPLISKETYNKINCWQKTMRRGALLFALITIEAAAIGLPIYFGMQLTENANQNALKNVCCPMIHQHPCPNPLPPNYYCINWTN